MQGPHLIRRGRHKAASYNLNTAVESTARSFSSTTEYHPARIAREPKHGRFENHRSSSSSGNSAMLAKAVGIEPCGVKWFTGSSNQFSTLRTRSLGLRPGGTGSAFQIDFAGAIYWTILLMADGRYGAVRGNRRLFVHRVLCHMGVVRTGPVLRLATLR